MTPRGIRNRNPGNLRDTDIPWRGLVGTDKDGFCIFDCPENGIRAMTRDIYGDWKKDGKRTLRSLIMEYAPPNENDTENYIRYVASHVGVEPDDPINLDDRSFLRKIIITKIQMECGYNPYPISVIDDGIERAF